MQTQHICATVCVLISLGQTPAKAKGDETAVIGDARLQVRVEANSSGLTEAEYLVEGRRMEGLRAVAWAARIDGAGHQSSGEIRRTGGGTTSPADEASFEGNDEQVRWLLNYRLSGPGRVTKTLTLTAKRDIRLEEVALWRSSDPSPPTVPRTTLQDIAAIFRQESLALFASLDFPYSLIETRDGTTTVSYPPFTTIKKDETYAAHSLTVGAIRLAGRTRYGADAGTVAALDSYVQQRFPPRFERPMILSCCINNRYTQPRGNVIFYTMKDHPTLRDNTNLLEQELALMPKLGVEYYQVFPGVFDYGPDDPSQATIAGLMSVARGHRVRMGDYSGTNGLFCPHYNEYSNHLDRPEWIMQGENGKPIGGFCFGHSDFVDHYIDTVVPTCRRFGFELHCLDFLSLAPCYAADHGHPRGRDGLYHQVSGLVRLLDAINGVSPEMMTWSNSGNWSELLPKIAWSNPNLYLTDPYIDKPWQGLNMTRLLDDARREQMVTLHHTRFVPYRFLTNCQYFFSQNSIVPDIRHYEYGALSTLAVTPNLCLGEIRPWLDRLTERNREHVTTFYQRWTTFVREHYDLWKKTYEAGEPPGMGAVEIYAHAAGDHGYIFVVNPQYWGRTVEVALDARLGFDGRGRCEIKELYPTPRLRLTSQGPSAALGSTVAIDVAAQQVLVLEVSPAGESVEPPRLYGVPGTIERNTDGYLIKTYGPQGRSERCAVLLPPDSATVTGAEARADVPKLPKRQWSPTPLQLWATPQGALLDLTFRGVAAPGELRDWTVKAAGLDQGIAAKWEDGLPEGEPARFPLFADVRDERILLPLTDAQADQAGLGPLANFCGAFIENAFAETQETWIQLKTGGQSQAPQSRPAGIDTRTGPHPLSALAMDKRTGWWLQTRFRMPFMYTIGAEPFFDEHTILVLPLVRHAQVRRIAAWINGTPLNVQLYRYPRNRGLGCYFADLVGSGAAGGDNTLVVHLQY